MVNSKRINVYHQHFRCIFDFFLSSEEDKNVTKWLRYMDLEDTHNSRIDVVGLCSPCVEYVNWISSARNTKNRRIIKELQRGKAFTDTGIAITLICLFIHLFTKARKYSYPQQHGDSHVSSKFNNAHLQCCIM